MTEGRVDGIAEALPRSVLRRRHPRRGDLEMALHDDLLTALLHVYGVAAERGGRRGRRWHRDDLHPAGQLYRDTLVDAWQCQQADVVVTARQRRVRRRQSLCRGYYHAELVAFAPREAWRAPADGDLHGLF